MRATRADARRNVEAILDAALRCLATDPLTSVNDIAKAAGVGRVTLYGRAIEQADEVLDAIDLTGDPRAALARLIASSWQIVDRSRTLLLAAERELPAERIRAHHDQPMRRVRALLQRGRRDGAFRADLPTDWLVATFYGILHGAAAEITAGRLDPDGAAEVITATLLAAYTPGPVATER
jgi:TetR/AcrR family transcriptional repressor of mexCD-oprJ operon